MTASTDRRWWLCALAMGLVACDGRSPSGPSPALPGAARAPVVTAIAPSTGSTVRPTPVIITGSGFLPGATVTIDVTALRATVLDGRTIAALIPAHGAGSADVVVTNQNGAGGTLIRAFTYVPEAPVTLTPSTSAVDAGGDLQVSWTSPGARAGDWIALCPVGRTYEDDWYGLTRGETSGTRTVTAPTRPGQYEFRYLVDDFNLSVAHSSPVTVR